MFQGKIFLYDWARRWIKWADIGEGTLASDTEAAAGNTPLDFQTPAARFTNIRDFAQLTSTAPISMELGPDGALYVAEFDGFWDAGPKANVSRYRWVEDQTQVLNEVSSSSQTAGERIYNGRCASCHQASGQGVSGVFPPLAASPWVTNYKSIFINVLLKSLSGEVEVDGVTYNGAMPPWASALSDHEIAAVLSHIRRSWGNSASPVSAAEVAAER